MKREEFATEVVGRFPELEKWALSKSFHVVMSHLRRYAEARVASREWSEAERVFRFLGEAYERSGRNPEMEDAIRTAFLEYFDFDGEEAQCRKLLRQALRDVYDDQVRYMDELARARARMPETKCKCGWLVRHALDPDVPVIYDEKSESFSLRLSTTVLQHDIFCFFCGGNSEGARIDPVKAGWCTCRIPQRWADDSTLPVRYGRVSPPMLCLMCPSAVSRELDREFAMWFCPACGGKLHDAPDLRKKGRARSTARTRERR